MDGGHQLECHKEGFATVSIFHLYAQQQHLGFFNLHFRKTTVFTSAQTALLETLGQLLGTAIENQRLQVRERELAISEERNLVAQGLHDSIAQGLNFLNLQVQMLEQSLKQKRFDEVDSIVPALRAGVDESYQDVRELLVSLYRERSGRYLQLLSQAQPGFESMLDYAQRHQEVIARFGRFPHRNAILGRASSPQEVEFLRQPGSSF